MNMQFVEAATVNKVFTGQKMKVSKFVDTRYIKLA